MQKWIYLNGQNDIRIKFMTLASYGLMINFRSEL